MNPRSGSAGTQWALKAKVLEMAVEIREAVESDLEVLVEFARREAEETEGVSPDPAAVRTGVGSALTGAAPATYWVARTDEGRAVGAVSTVTEWSNFRGGHYWWIQSLYIVEEHRGTGLVERLMDTVAQAAAAAGALDLRLYVLRSNERAIAAYARYGFVASEYAIMTLPVPGGRSE